MKRNLAHSSRRWGRQLIATATLLVLPVAAIAWLSPGLATAADASQGVEGVFAFETAAVNTVANLPAEVAVSADNWSFTKKTEEEKQAEKELKEQQKEEKKAFKECQKDQKKSFKETGVASPATCFPA